MSLVPSLRCRFRSSLAGWTGLALVLSGLWAGCRGGEGNAASLEVAVRRSLQLMNTEDWESAYGEVLTRSQRATCSLAEYAERESAGLAMLRDSVGSGEIDVIELGVEVRGEVGLVTGTLVYTQQLSELGEQVRAEGPVTGARMVARRNLGTATAENPDYWIHEDGGWRWVQRRPDSPCYNEADMKTIQAVADRSGSESGGPE